MLNWKNQVRAAVCGLYRACGAMALQEAARSALGRQSMTILLFHRVTDVIPEDGLTVSTARFRQMCRLLATRFRVVPLAEVFRIRRTGERMPPRTVAITFDDCYRDNLDAARVLAEFGLHCTFFVPTAFVGTQQVFSWDRDKPAMPNLTWDEVREMVRMGFEIGSHTINHPNLGAVDAGQARHEICDSRIILQERLGQPVRWFAYPFGARHHFRPEYLPLLAEAGYEGAVSAYGGFVKPDSDPWLLPREAVPYFKSMAHLEMHMSGCLHWLYSLRGREEHRDPWVYSGGVQPEGTKTVPPSVSLSSCQEGQAEPHSEAQQRAALLSRPGS